MREHGGCENEKDKKTLRLRKREKRMKKRMNEKVPKALTKKVEKPPHTPYLRRIFLFEHELPRMTMKKLKTMLLASGLNQYIGHEICRRPTDQREVI